MSMNAPASLPAPRRLQSVEELDSAITQLSFHLNAVTYRLLELVREFDDRLGWAKWSFPNCSEWLAWRCGLSLSAAREKIRTAHALRGLPAISSAFSKGRLSYSKVRALTRVANPSNEDLLLAYALDATAAQVEERSRQMRNVAPDSADVARRAWERRSLTIVRDASAGMTRITLEVPTEDGEVFAKAIDRAVETGRMKLGPEFEATGWRSQQADAAMELARAYLSADSHDSGDASDASGARRASSAADHYQVVVHVDDSALRGGAGRSDLPVETVRRLTCDGSVIRLTEDADGNPLDIGRRQRTVPAAIRRALQARDRGCSFPGCERDHYLDAHHIEHWALGGETSLDNLTLLCTQHHRLLHEGRFRIRRGADGRLCFERRDGRVIPAGGYRMEDVLDADVDAADSTAADDTALVASIDRLLERIVRSRKPSAEVRESRGVYRLTASQTDSASPRSYRSRRSSPADTRVSRIARFRVRTPSACSRRKARDSSIRDTC